MEDTEQRKLVDWIDSYVGYTDETEPAYNLRLWVGLSVIASVLQRRCYLTWQKRIYPNMYVVLVSPSGKGRKGTAMDCGFPFLNELGIPLAAESVTREALIMELAKAKAEEYEDGVPYEHCSLTIYSPELAVFLGQQNNQLMSDLTDWYDCRDIWTYRTKHMGTDNVRGVYVNLLGATTPTLLTGTLNQGAIGGGLTSRIIFVYECSRGKTVVFPFLTILSEEHKQLYEDLLLDLRSIDMLRGGFKIDESFMDKWADWYPNQAKQFKMVDYKLMPYIERRPTHILKLCMIYSVSRSNDMIVTGEDFDKSINTLLITEKKMHMAFSGVGQSQYALVTSDIMDFITQQKRVRLGEILNVFHRDVGTRDELVKILCTLESMGFCKIERVNKRMIVSLNES